MSFARRAPTTPPATAFLPSEMARRRAIHTPRHSGHDAAARFRAAFAALADDLCLPSILLPHYADDSNFYAPSRRRWATPPHSSASSRQRAASSLTISRCHATTPSPSIRARGGRAIVTFFAPWRGDARIGKTRLSPMKRNAAMQLDITRSHYQARMRMPRSGNDGQLARRRPAFSTGFAARAL